MKLYTESATALAIIVTITMPNIVFAEAELFGKAHLSFGAISEDNGITKTSSTAIASHASRFGIKGFVWQIDMTDAAKSSNDHIKSREQYVGLKNS